MTTAPTSTPLRWDLTGFTGCSGYQAMEFPPGSGKFCDAGNGWEPDKTDKSEARCEMEHRLRLSPNSTTAADLRALFVDMCVKHGPKGAAPLLGDVVLLTAMTNDYRVDEEIDERAVRKRLVEDLTTRLEREGKGRLVVKASLKYVYWFAREGKGNKERRLWTD